MMTVAPRWALERLRARMVADAAVRGYEAAQIGNRRTAGWRRPQGDINSLTLTATPELRIHARQLTRNNGWAKRAKSVVSNNVVGNGVIPRPVGLEEAQLKKATELWKAWALDSTECDSERRNSMSGLQKQMIGTIFESGEVLVRRRPRRPGDGLTIPLQIQVLEPDYLDTTKDGINGPAGGPIIQGVEFDKIGRRVAYWLFPEHPGSLRSAGLSQRVPASEILHAFETLRPQQVRGISWLASVIVPLKDFDDFEDAELVKQKIAACFAAFVTDEQGTGTALADQDPDDDAGEMLEPGAIKQLPAGKKVTFGNPPGLTSDALPTRTLRKIAAGLDVTYEDLSQDYSQVNFSSARMARLSHWASVKGWQWDLMIPQLCAGIWAWAMEAAVLSGDLSEAPAAEWTATMMPMLEPDKEARAAALLVRAGVLTPDEMIRGQGGDPLTHWNEYEANVKALKARGIVLDSLASDVSQAGLTQQRAGAVGGGEGPPEKDEVASLRSALSEMRAQLGLPPL